MDERYLEPVSCDLCGCAKQRVLFRTRDTTTYWRAKCAEVDGLDAEMEFPVVECEQCSHVFVSPRLRPEIVADIYARFWKSFEPTEMPRDEFAIYLCRQLAELRGQPGKLLDFGSGWGSYLYAAKQIGWDAIGIEVDTAKIDFARRYGVTAMKGDLLDRQFEESSFDAVIAQQVFEHLYDPVAYLKEVRRILKPGGVLFISVPNYGGIAARVSGQRWEMVSPVGHVRYFTRRTLAHMLEEHGFTVVRKRYVKRFEKGSVRNAVYQLIVFVENELNIYPHNLSLYARRE